ncbi:unnamed protein product, partial [Prorocentrum cordatum]
EEEEEEEEEEERCPISAFSAPPCVAAVPARRLAPCPFAVPPPLSRRPAGLPVLPGVRGGPAGPELSGARGSGRCCCSKEEGEKGGWLEGRPPRLPAFLRCSRPSGRPRAPGPPRSPRRGGSAPVDYT